MPNIDRLRIRLPMGSLRLVPALGLTLYLGGAPWLPPASVWFLALVVVYVVGALSAIDFGARPPLDWLQPHLFAIGLAAITFVGIWFRLSGVSIGLGHTPVDMDEGRLAGTVLHFFQTGEVEHATVEDYPGALFWLLTGSYLFVYLHALMHGVASDLKAVPIELFVLGGRVVNTLLAAGTIALTGVLGRAVGGRRAGLVAALVVAVVPLAVETSTELRNEAAQLLLILAAVWAALRLARQTDPGATVDNGVHEPARDLRFAAFAGSLAAAATAIKYSSVFALLPALVACLMPAIAANATRDPSLRGALRRVGIVALFFLAALATTNPFLWADFPNFVRQLATEVRMSGAHHWSAQANPRWYYSRILGTLGPGWTLLVLAGGYAVAALVTGQREALILVAFPLSYLWFMTERPAQFPRWVYPLTPFVAVAGSTALWAIIDRVQQTTIRTTRSSVAARWLIMPLAIAALAQPLWRGAILWNRRTATPTYGLVEAWLRRHAAVGDRVLLTEGWLDLKGAGLRLNRVPSLGPILGGGIYQICYNDWVVVPEPDMRRVEALKRLRLAETFLADSSAHGNVGFDFAVYATPPLQPTTGTIDFALDHDEAQPFLGSEWPQPQPGIAGRFLPDEGASIYLPPLPKAERRLYVELEVSLAREDEGDVPLRDVSSSTPITVELENEPLAVDEVLRKEPKVSWSSVPIAAGVLPKGVVRVRLIPARSAKIRVLRFAVSG